MPAQIAIRADGGESLGLGHLKRCVPLAKALREDGYDVAFVRTARRDGAVAISTPFRTLWLEDGPVVPVGGQLADAEATLSTLGSLIADTSWVVVDHYALSSDWEKRVGQHGPRILAIDDFRDRIHCADILVSDSPQPFDPDSAGRSVQLVGPQYALLDDEFAFAPSHDQSAPGRRRLLVTFGGSDPTGETSKVVEALGDLRPRCPDLERFDVDVVVGAVNPAVERLRESARALPWITLHISPATLAPLIKDADLVITSGGNTMVETLSLRTPCLVIMTSANQQLLVDELRRRNVVAIAGWHAGTRAEDIGIALRPMLDGLSLLTRRLRESVVFDHLGARRVSEVMRKMDAVRDASHRPGGATGTLA